MATDTENVSADIHVAPVEGGLYRNADGQYVDAHGNVLDEKKKEDKEKIQTGLDRAEASAEKRKDQAASAPALPGSPLNLTQAELDAKVQLAVQTALAKAGKTPPKP